MTTPSKGALALLLAGSLVACKTTSSASMPAPAAAEVDAAAKAEAAPAHEAMPADAAGAVAAAPAQTTGGADGPWCIDDPANDDHGPAGKTYAYPQDGTFKSPPNLNDVQKVCVEKAADGLKLSITMANTTDTWTPNNKFSHVGFVAYFNVPQSPQKTMAQVMPFQAASVPAELGGWNFRLRSGGWMNAFYSAVEAAPDYEGTRAPPLPVIEAAPPNKTISFTIAGKSFGNPASFSGTKVYVSAYDFNTLGDHIGFGLRCMSRSPSQWCYSGGDGATSNGGVPKDPIIMDDTAILSIP